MKAVKIFIPALTSIFFLVACGDNKSNTENTPAVADSTSNNPTTNALDYHNDQRQQIPSPDSSNTVGTDTINSSEATPNTGTNKSFNDSSRQK